MSDNHGVKCGSPDEPCSCGPEGYGEETISKATAILADERVQQAIADAIVGKLDPISLEPNRYVPKYPDLLALEVENRRLGEALKKCNSWAFEPDRGAWSDTSIARFHKDMEEVDKALSTPPIVTSALWRVLKDAINNLELFPSVRTLTPELRALIEEMTKDG